MEGDHSQLGPDLEPDRVLAAADADGQKLELVRDPDGFFVITLDGLARPGYRWPAECVEDCVKIYLALLRHRPEA